MEKIRNIVFPSKIPAVTIEIVGKGSIKFRRALVDRIYELMMDEDFLSDVTAPGNSFEFTSSIPPSEEVL